MDLDIYEQEDTSWQDSCAQDGVDDLRENGVKVHIRYSDMRCT